MCCNKSLGLGPLRPLDLHVLLSEGVPLCIPLTIIVQPTTLKMGSMHSVSFSFCLHLSLSVSGWLAIWLYTSHLSYHSAIYTQKYKYFLFWNVWPNCHLAIFNKKGAKIFEQLNGNPAIQSHLAIHTQIQMQTESEAFKTHRLTGDFNITSYTSRRSRGPRGQWSPWSSKNKS